MQSTRQYALSDSSRWAPRQIQDALEQGEVVWFEQCPVELPSLADLDLLRDGLAGSIGAKNLSYHPESDSVPRFAADDATRQRVESVLRTHGQRVAAFLQRQLPDLVPGWRPGTTSFRPMEERGRNLQARASNELVHIDAGAYGATNGDRILRFFVNVHPTRDRVWSTKGSLGSLMARDEALWAAARAGRDGHVPLRKGPLGRAYSGLVQAAARVYPLARAVDSSPYDRAMRRMHNHMKQSEVFQTEGGQAEIRFPPGSAWMVFTDGFSHAVREGQHALVTTAVIPLANCRDLRLTPYGILSARR